MANERPSSSSQAVHERHAGGRRPDASRDDELRGVTLKLLAEIGYERLTMDAVAAGAGAGKATLYRRWSGKAELVLDAIISAKSQVANPDTGSLYGDLVALFQHGADREGEFDAQVMVGLVSAMARDHELRDAFQERMVAPLLSVLTEVFDRAVARGEIEPVQNVELVASIVPAIILYRHMVFGDAFNSSTLRSVVDDVLMPLVTFTSRAPKTRVTTTS